MPLNVFFVKSDQKVMNRAAEKKEFSFDIIKEVLQPKPFNFLEKFSYIMSLYNVLYSS